MQLRPGRFHRLRLDRAIFRDQFLTERRERRTAAKAVHQIVASVSQTFACLIGVFSLFVVDLSTLYCLRTTHWWAVNLQMTGRPAGSSSEVNESDGE